MQKQLIERRFVLLGGYYPFAPAETRRKLKRDHARFCKTWSLSGEVIEEAPTAAWLPSVIRTEGPDWRSVIAHNHFYWDDLIEEDRQRGWTARFFLSLLTFFDFIRRGALIRYFRTAWRYGAFFLYPFVLLFAIMALASVTAHITLNFFAVPQATLWRWPLAALLLAGFLPLFGNALRIDHLLDDWIYGRRIAHEGDAAVTARLSLLADELARETREILIVGHSFGAVHGVELINLVRQRAPDGPPIRFASVGSSILKIALYGGAKNFRKAIETMANAKNIIWRDLYAVNDYMNFCDANPVTVLGLTGTGAKTLKVQFRGMIDPDYYNRMELNYFRLHSQFIAVNDRIAPYDYFMMMCGPWSLEMVTRDRRGFFDLLDEKGFIKPQAVRT